jgi:hypothetical protein
MNDNLKTIGLYIGLLGLSILGTRGCNSAFNNRTIDNPAYHTKSHATGIVGHVEYTRYKDGSQDVKTYPGFLSHRIMSSELYQDLNGDGLVDRIRQDGPEWKMHRLKNILIRDYDYSSNKDKFDKADRKLQELHSKYALN